MIAITTKRFPVGTYLTVDVEAGAMTQDPPDEQNLQETINEVAAGMTTIMIATMTSLLGAEEVIVGIEDVRSHLWLQDTIC